MGVISDACREGAVVARKERLADRIAAGARRLARTPSVQQKAKVNR